MTNYPPTEILHPSYAGKPDYELIILWLLNNNDVCTWTELSKDINKSTLSNYLTRLKAKGFIIKAQYNQYRVTPSGKERFHEKSKLQPETDTLNFPPHIIMNKRIYDDLILWMVFNNNSCRWADFLGDPLRINHSSLSKAIRRLIDHQFIEKNDKIYQITYFGKEAYAGMLSNYHLDRYYILEQESRRITQFTQKALPFFSKYQISDHTIRFRFLQNLLKLPYDRVKQNLEQEEDFWKILLFLAINHPSNRSGLISVADFAKKYRLKEVILDFYLLQIVENQIYPTKFFQLRISGEKSAFFQENEKLELFLRAAVTEYITQFTYLNKLHENLEEKNPLTMDLVIEGILTDIASAFHPDFEMPLRFLLAEFTSYLTLKIEKNSKGLDSAKMTP